MHKSEIILYWRSEDRAFVAIDLPQRHKDENRDRKLSFIYCFLVSISKSSDLSANESSIYGDDFGQTNKRRFRKSCIFPLLQDNVGDKAEAAKMARHHGDHIMLVQPFRLRYRKNQTGPLFGPTEISEWERDQYNVKRSHTLDRPRYPIPGRIALQLRG